jgi:hypothetical protein
MERDMSYELDGMFSGRNAGELVTVQQTRTKVVRSPGLHPVARMPGGDVKNITPALAQHLNASKPHSIFGKGFKSLGLPMAKSLSKPIFHQPSDLAEYDDDYDMPFDGIGFLDTVPPMAKSVIIGAAVLGALYFISR